MEEVSNSEQINEDIWAAPRAENYSSCCGTSNASGEGKGWAPVKTVLDKYSYATGDAPKSTTPSMQSKIIFTAAGLALLVGVGWISYKIFKA